MKAKALYCLVIEVDTCSTQYRIIDKFSCHTHPPIKWTSFKDIHKDNCPAELISFEK